jgi:hypothetical protein
VPHESVAIPAASRYICVMTRNDDTAAARADRWARAKDLFSDLVALPAHERAIALDAQCGGDAELRRFVESLLAADADYAETRDDPMLRDVHAALDRLASGVVRGRRFGAFAVVEEIGRGGMGVVYLAERHDGKVAQRVALKLVASGHLDADASARLARERRLLATLEHANIARLIDAGEDPAASRISRWNTSTACRSRAGATNVGSCWPTGCGCSARSARPCSTRMRTSSFIATSRPATSS